MYSVWPRYSRQVYRNAVSVLTELGAADGRRSENVLFVRRGGTVESDRSVGRIRSDPVVLAPCTKLDFGRLVFHDDRRFELRALIK